MGFDIAAFEKAYTADADAALTEYFWTKSDDKESFTMSRRLIREEGLLCGGSSGGSMHHAIQGKKITSWP